MSSSSRPAPPAAIPEPPRRGFLQHWVIDPLDGLWKVPLHHSLRLAPIGACSAIGALLGRFIVPSVYPGWDARARRNYLRLLPDTSPAELDRAMRTMWSNLGRTYTEFSALDRLWDSGRIEVRGAGHLLEAQRSHRPYIMAAVHLGNWELTGLSFVSLGLEGCSIFQPVGTRFEWRVVIGARSRTIGRRPLAMHPPGPGSARVIHRAVVRNRQGLHIHIDESLQGRINAPSFGRPSDGGGNIATAVRLALAADAVLVPAYSERLGESARFRLVIEPPFALERSGDRDADVSANVARLDAHIGAIIRPRLAQWMMLRENIFD